MASSIEVDTRELEKFAVEMRRVDMKKDARGRVRDVAQSTVRQIKDDMPVRTGAARDSWNISDEGDLSVAQGSDLSYIEALNAGHSTQAPAGFIDRAQAKAEIMLVRILGDIDPLR